MHTLWQENINKNRVILPPEQAPYKATSIMIRQAKGAILKSVKKETPKYWNERISKLAFQGNFIQLLIKEKQNITWKSNRIMYQVKYYHLQ